MSDPRFTIIWIFLCLLVAKYVGQPRKIGAVKSFILCVIFSPLFGAIITSFSSRLSKDYNDDEIKNNN
jgi:hypothetical protein